MKIIRGDRLSERLKDAVIERFALSAGADFLSTHAFWITNRGYLPRAGAYCLALSLSEAQQFLEAPEMGKGVVQELGE